MDGEEWVAFILTGFVYAAVVLVTIAAIALLIIGAACATGGC